MFFSQDTFRFLGDLEANNDKRWFDDHREQYDAHWKSAALDFIDAVASSMATLTPGLKAEARINGSLRRINRDVRFSKDKSPYNPRLHLIFWSGGHPNRSPAMHLVLQPRGIGYGAGQFGIEPKDLAKFRTRIVDEKDGPALEKALEAAAKVDCKMGPPELSRLPRGYEEGPRAELLRYKTFVARTHDTLAPPEVLIGEKAVDWTLETTSHLMPFIRWLTPD